MQISLYIELSQLSKPTHFSHNQFHIPLHHFHTKMATATSVVGPFGGPTGDNWNDGSIYSGIKVINLSYAEAIGNFNVIYDLNGNTYPGPRHYAGIGPTYTHDTVTLNYPNEYITSVEGYYGPLPGTRSNVVRSLSFKTNTGRTYGPYGVQHGTPFTASGTKIVGFIGRTGYDYLEAIGFYKTT